MAWQVKLTAYTKDGRELVVWGTAHVRNPLIAPDCVTYETEDEDNCLPDEMYDDRTERMVWEVVQAPVEAAR